MHMACLDLEGVLVPEVWIGVAEQTGLSELRATTRDIPVYDTLMKQRIRILNEQCLGIHDIRKAVASLRPLEGALDFLSWLRDRFQVVILSDTFYEIAMPLIEQLGNPTLFCNRLVVDGDGKIVDYKMRQAQQKREAVRAFRTLNYRIVACGDSYNDVTMLSEADSGIFFRPPATIADEFPRFPVAQDYGHLKELFESAWVRFENEIAD